MPRAIRILLAVALVPVSAAGQAGVGFEFTFSNPGARSMGFGGAFVALADDATAAFANPAGLVQLVEPEVSIDVRAWSYSMPFTRSGRITGEPTGLGLDTQAGVHEGRSDHDPTGLSFLSFVYPRKKWSIAFYRHLQANFKTEFVTNGLFAEAEDEGPLNTFRLPERWDTNEFEMVTYGLSGAFQILESLSLGLGLTFSDGFISGRQAAYRWENDSLESFFGEVALVPENLSVEQIFLADDTDLGLAAGLLWHLNESWNLGAFYRRGPEFRFDVEVRFGPASQPPNPPSGSTASLTTSIASPDVYGAGLAYRLPTGNLTLSFEWDRVLYSAIFDSLGDTASEEFIPDGDELHLGAEYAFLSSRPLFAIRAGIWRDPNHQVQSNLDHVVIRALLGEGSAQTHYALGFGTAFKRFQLDLGIDFSERQDTLSVSGIYSW